MSGSRPGDPVDPSAATVLLDEERPAPTGAPHPPPAKATLAWIPAVTQKMAPGTVPDETITVRGVSGAAPPTSPSASRAPGRLSLVVHEYADGKRLTAGGDVPTGPVERVVTLPYRSSDVLLRIGSYEVVKELGRGGMGVVYKAWALQLSRWCAIKVLLTGEHASEAQIIRFQNEARLAAHLNHPNITQVFDLGEDTEGRPYFVMEFVEGRDLSALIRSGSARDVETGVRALAKVARALAYAHEKGIVHRDIKPDNILVDAAGEPHITDFGIAKSLEERAGMTREGALMGTPHYMPPEQANGELNRIGPLSDVYALGATLYHLVTGRTPFVGDSPVEVMIQVLERDPDRPRDVAKKVRGVELPLDLETICLKAMEKIARQRYASAAELAEDLEAFVADRPIQARPIGPRERLQKLVRRNRGAMIATLLVGVTLVVMTVAFGTVLIFNINRTTESLRELDRKAGLDQALTLESAIRTNMLQGRADVVRELVAKLRGDENLTAVEVVRTDRTFAYTDRATRVQVEKRLRDPRVLGWIEETRPKMLPRIEDLKRVGFDNIDGNPQAAAGLFAFDRAEWKALVDAKEVQVRQEVVDGEPVLTVLKPIENSEGCQTCHGEPGEDGYDANEVRAVLVVQRSQKDLETRIAANRNATMAVGATTTGVLLALLFLLAKVFGLGPKPRRYGR